MRISDSLGNITDVIVKQDRYDELLHKEALLDSIKKLCDRLSDYAVRDAIVHLLKTEAEVKTNE